MRNLQFTTCLAIVGFLVSLGQSSAQVVLYDNLGNVRSDGNSEDYLTPGGSNGRIAQQFFLGDHTNIDQVTVFLLRTPSPGGTGSLRLELWRDNGSDQPVAPDDPTGKIADLGKVVDVTKIPAGTFGEYTFDNLILGLEPNNPYWIVTNHEEVSGNNAVGVATVFGGDPMYPDPPGYDPTAGTNGAAHIHANRNQNPHWRNLKEFFGLEHFYQAMKVEAMQLAAPGAPLVGDFNNNAQLDSIDIDMLSSQYRRVPDDGLFDLDNDGSLTQADREAWVHNLANTNFGDSNLDGEFNSDDVTTVLQAGEYDDNITLNSTWAEGDWDGNGDFDNADIVFALQHGGYAQGPRAAGAVYEAIQSSGKTGDGQTSLIYNARTGELAVDAPVGVELTSINIDSAVGTLTGQAAANLGGSFDNDADRNIYKATFGSSFGSLSFGNVAQMGLTEEFVLEDLTVIGSLAGGGDLGSVDLVYVRATARGDFNGDGILDVTDIDLLSAEILEGSNNPAVDLTDDDIVDAADLAEWRSVAAVHNGFDSPYLLGDADLDGIIDSTDLNNLALNWQQKANAWSQGDFDVNGIVDSADLNHLAINWRQAIPMASAVSVPEPSASLLVLLGISLVRRPRIN